MQYVDSKIRIDITLPLFTQDPSIRFAETMGVSPDFARDMWVRLSTLGYSKHDLAEWFQFKTKKEISLKTIDRWISRHEIYKDAQIAVQAGAKQVTIEYFKRNQQMILDLTKAKNG